VSLGEGGRLGLRLRFPSIAVNEVVIAVNEDVISVREDISVKDDVNDDVMTLSMGEVLNV